MRPRKAGNLNIWKCLFLAQLALLIGCGIVLYTRIQTDREDLTKLVQTSTEDTKVGTFSTNREQLNQTLTNYLKEYQTEEFSYQLFVTSQQVVFEGSYQIFGVTIPLYIYFQPSKMEDGSILLRITEISVGSLSLPKAEVLAYLQKNYKLPAFVKIDSEQAQVQVQLTELKNKFGLYGKANTIDLYNDQFIVDIYRKRQ
ncbi:TPA: YpmS family protein [Streptococcus suis]|uniref:YpmS family protein n=1 Tax=Streptococcus suis TaxID=1307 RepID=UPI0009450455|nr:YpmS family protein [Streptococcus suis]MCB2907142.1 YpmS family protein [Streptococcus suis]HEL2223907.1 YpmS family protein [Streptococcus suis]HEL2343541.1 YpmS family protein [Streptococcus suis]HEL2348096.1 YpmS family protein [Streptococcus suis]HEL2535311.1 YpmS family protein [Streptococcus suis]